MAKLGRLQTILLQEYLNEEISSVTFVFFLFVDLNRVLYSFDKKPAADLPFIQRGIEVVLQGNCGCYCHIDIELNVRRRRLLS